jgi:hypothetical protein
MSRTRRLVAVAAAAAAIAAAAPASRAVADTAAGPCKVVSQSTGSEVAIVLVGNYTTKTGGDVILTCYLVQNGVKVASARDSLRGPVAALVSDQRLNTSPFTVCYAVAMQDISPWGLWHHFSDC